MKTLKLITEMDFNFKELKEKHTLDIDTQHIKLAIYETVKPQILNSMVYLHKLLIPYCEENKLYQNVIVSKHGDKKVCQTKNWSFFLYEHNYEGMKVFVHDRYAHTELFIMLSHPKYLIHDMLQWEDKLIDKMVGMEHSILMLVSLNCQYSDDEYIAAKQTAVDNILKHIDSKRDKRYYGTMLWNPYCCPHDENKVKIKQTLNTRYETGELNDGWMDTLFDLSCNHHYIPPTTFD